MSFFRRKSRKKEQIRKQFEGALAALHQNEALKKEYAEKLDKINQEAKEDARHVMKIFPKSEYWRFFIDGILQKYGWAAFDSREPGYLKPLLKQLHRLFTNKEFQNEKVTPSFIKQLHKNAIAGVENTNYDTPSYDDNLDEIETLPGRFRYNNFVQFNLNESSASIAGIQEILHRIETQTPVAHANHLSIQFSVSIKNQTIDIIVSNAEELKNAKEYCKQNNMSLENFIYNQTQNNRAVFIESSFDINFFDAADRTAKNVEKLLNYAIEIYEDLLEKNKNNNLEKIVLTTTLIHFLEQLHPFIDANCRTLCMLLFYHQLMRHNFIPPMQADPNRFNCHTPLELMAYAIDEMALTLQATKGKKEFYGMTTEQLINKNPKSKSLLGDFAPSRSDEKIQESQKMKPK